MIKRLKRMHAALLSLALFMTMVSPMATALAEQFRLVQGQSALKFSEFMSSNASSFALSDGTYPDWLEIVNASEDALNVSGYTIMLDEDALSLSRLPAKTLEAGETLVLIADGKDALSGHVGFKLPSAGATVTLLDPQGAVADRIEVPKLEADQVYCLDDAGEWQISVVATPGDAANVVALPGSVEAQRFEDDLISGGEVVLTEAMARAVTWADGRDYVELRNVSDKAVNLENWALSDDPGKPAKWLFPAVTIGAGETLVVYCTGEDQRDNAYSLSTSFRLSASGETVTLTDAQGKTVSVMSMPALNVDQAYSLYDGAWTTALPPTPGLTNTWENAHALEDNLLKSSGSSVRINELCAVATDERPDWIELYNFGSQTVDLSEYALSDTSKHPGRWTFPEGTTIAPGAFLGVFCTGGESVDGGWLTTDFKLSAQGGDTLVLSHREGDRYVCVDSVYVPRQYDGYTYGRRENGSGFGYYEYGTPLAANVGTIYTARMPDAAYTVQGGLYRSGDVVAVALEAPAGARIHYTLDCSDPTEASPVYTTPIMVSETTILRARVYRDGYLPSYMNTQSYLYDVNNGSGVFVVSLVSDRVNLFSDESGIMVLGPGSPEAPYKGANFLQDWEREAHLEIYAASGRQVVSSECGVKLHGEGSRKLPQQAFKLIARQKYGDNRFHMSLFSKRPYTEYQSIVIRSSGQDTRQTRMRDSIFTALAEGTSVYYQETEVCVVYLDGEYWGQYNLRERINAVSICQFEGWEGQEDDIDIGSWDTIVLQGDCSTYTDLVEYSRTADPTTDAFYAHVDEIIDIRNYIEYMAIEMFVGNGDTHNVKRYRNKNADGKWRWVLFDLDWGFVTDTNSIRRWLTPGGMGSGQNTNNDLFIACMKNPRFRDEFLTYMGEQMATTFSTEHMISLFDARLQILEPLLPDQLSRWDMTEEKYKKELKKLYNYAKERPEKLIGYFSTCEYLGLSDAEMEHYFGAALREAERYRASN